ncbi:MAG TPA: hypothetical protein VFF86_08415 [Candidatus Methylomirabilis sp.]|nr:hypothetical protein [Candidatus Methylomirabilis sp.]
MTDQRLVFALSTMLGIMLMATTITLATEEPIRALEGALEFGPLAGAVGAPGRTPREAAPSTPGVVTLRAEGLTNKEFRTRLKGLSEHDIVEISGRKMTKAQFRNEIEQKRKKAWALVKGNAAQFQLRLEALRGEFEALRGEFEAQQKATLEASNARARAGFARLAQQWDPGAASQVARMGASSERETVRREAAELMRRVERASPAEQAEIEKRAQQLLQRAKQLGR